MIPTLASSTEVSPGQFGPISRVPAARSTCVTRSMSSAGHALGDADDERDAARPRPRASRRGRRPPGRRCTRRWRRSARPPRRPCRRPAPARRARSGRPSRASRRRRCSSRTRAWRVEWNSPSRPVMPWTRSRVSRLTKMLIARRASDGLGRRVVERVGGDEVRLGQDRLGLRRRSCRRCAPPSAPRGRATHGPRRCRGPPRRRG